MKAVPCIILLAIINFSCQKEVSTNGTVATATLTTAAATSVTSALATSGGNITDDGGAPVTARGVCWSTSPNPDVTGNHTTDGAGSGAFASNITGLASTTTYYVRAYAINSAGTAYGNQVSFTTTNTASALATVTTSALSSVTTTTASGGGNVAADGGATVTARGICWSTTANPVVTGNHTTDGTGTGSFTSAVTGLTAATTYHVRAYATNSVGTAYGGDSVFTTASGNTIPTITTTAISAITGISAASGGTISTDGGAPVTARGVCWSTTANPTIALTTKTTDGTGIGIFTSAITGLTSGTTYHVRAYATNSAGTAYGAEEIFIPADVYIAGYESTSSTTTVAKYWKNGTPVILPSTDPVAYANDIFVSGTDVYVAGSTFFTNGVNKQWSAVIWKNGVPTILAQSVFGNNGSRVEATSVFVSGSDVYVAGSTLNAAGTGSIVKVWKNGVATDLTAGTNLAKGLSVYVSGTDVYVAGYEFITGGSGIAKYWKNGVATSLSSTANNAQAESIFVSGTDVYVGGTESNGGLTLYARLWKNGVATTLTSGAGSGYVHDLCVSGSDVYAAGEDYITTSSSSSVAKTWKNGAVTTLPGPTPAYGTAIAVIGSDVYVAGNEWNGTRYLPKCWKNNVSTTLANTNGAIATGIFVQ